MRDLDIKDVNFDDNGLAPCVVQNHETGKVLMLGYMNLESLKLTLSSRRVTFYSRSRQQLWEKGESSGNTLEVVQVYLDCDGDAILAKVKPIGPTCHTGAESCFEEA